MSTFSSLICLQAGIQKSCITVYGCRVPGPSQLASYQRHVSAPTRPTVICWCNGVSLLTTTLTSRRQRFHTPDSVMEDSVTRRVSRADLASLSPSMRMIHGSDFTRDEEDVLGSSGRVQCAAGKDSQEYLTWTMITILMRDNCVVCMSSISVHIGRCFRLTCAIGMVGLDYCNSLLAGVRRRRCTEEIAVCQKCGGVTVEYICSR